MWEEGKKKGQGSTAFPNGDTYTGEFADNEFNGQGEFKYANGDRYDARLCFDAGAHTHRHIGTCGAPRPLPPAPSPTVFHIGSYARVLPSLI